MFLITRFCKPLDLLYCRFKSNQNTFLNKGKHTKIFLFLNRTFVSQKCLLEFFVDNLFLLDLIHCTTCFLIFQPCGYLCTPPPQSRFFCKTLICVRGGGGLCWCSCSPLWTKSAKFSISCLLLSIIYNFPLMRAPSCLSINIFLPLGPSRTKKWTNSQNWVHSILATHYCPNSFLSLIPK